MHNTEWMFVTPKLQETTIPENEESTSAFYVLFRLIRNINVLVN